MVGISAVRLRGNLLPTTLEVIGGLGAAAALTLLVVLVAVPVATTVQSNETVVREHSVGVETAVAGGLLATLTDAHSGTNATLTLEDNATGETETLTIDNGTSEGLTLSGVPITLTVTNATDATATVEYELAADAYLPALAQQALVPLLTVVLIVIVGTALAIVRDAL